VEKDGGKTTSSYDRNTNEFRILNQQRWAYPSGRIGSGLADAFGARELLETVMYPLHIHPLCNVIKFGIASEQTEKVDGFECVRIEIPSTVSTTEKYLVWLDPTIGYNPRKIEFLQKGIQPDVILFKDYKQVSDGVWFPRTQCIQYGSAQHSTAETITVENRVTSITVGRVIPKNEVLVEFPPDACVVR
jgi:hypothetical protein